MENTHSDKKKQLNINLRKHYWLIGRNSQLSMDNKLLIYKSIIKPIWMYGIELWGSASNSNIRIIQRFQNKTLRIITNAPQFIPNIILHSDLAIKTIQEEAVSARKKYLERLTRHPNILANKLIMETPKTGTRLIRKNIKL